MEVHVRQAPPIPTPRVVDITDIPYETAKALRALLENLIVGGGSDVGIRLQSLWNQLSKVLEYDTVVGHEVVKIIRQSY